MTRKDTAGLENLSFTSASKLSVIKEIGRGGMGIVSLAKKNTGGVMDDVVLKSVRTLQPEEEEKLKQEASIATMLRHENIVKTYGLELVPFSKLPIAFRNMLEGNQDQKTFLERLGLKKNKIEEEKNLVFLVMDYIKGCDFHTLLTQHLKKDILFPIPLAAFVISRIASALAYAHAYIIHRDIAPDNILISEQGVCKLTDFGVAVISHQQPEDWAGKLMYMAPEQLRNNPIDERADIFALGIVAYQAITGIPLLFAPVNLPFEEQVKMVYAQMENSLIPPHQVRSDVPLEISRIIAKMISFAPEYRYQRASVVVNDLEKDYLYARGYGPTNNSLAAYIDIFKSDFQEYNEEQLEQLSFLKDETGQIRLKRSLTIEGYTKAGQKLLAERKDSLIVERLRGIYQKKQKKTVAVPRIEMEKLPVIKVQYLSNVMETFSLKEQPITVGRSRDNMVVLPHLIVSGHHAKFFLKDNLPVAEDLGSQNGTFMNANKIQRVQLREGDRVQIGKNFLYFLMEKKPIIPQDAISLTQALQMDDLSTADLTLQFISSEEMFSKLPEFIEKVLKHVHLGELKQSVIPMAIYEAVRIFAGSKMGLPTMLRILRLPRYIGFYVIPAEQSDGYQTFLNMVTKRVEKEEEEEALLELEAEEIASSLILKTFDRIELWRSRKEVCFWQSLV